MHSIEVGDKIEVTYVYRRGKEDRTKPLIKLDEIEHVEGDTIFGRVRKYRQSDTGWSSWEPSGWEKVQIEVQA